MIEPLRLSDHHVSGLFSQRRTLRRLLLGMLVLMGAGCPENDASPVIEPGDSVAAPAADAPPSGGLLAGLDEPAAVTSEEAGSEYALRFEDVHEEAGIDFIFNNGSTAGKKLMPEATAGGGAWLDYDADGRPDLFFAQGGMFIRDSWRSQPRDKLFRNLGGGRFDDVSSRIRIDDEAYGHGVSIADFNQDGFDDVYVSNVGGDDVLLQNLGDGTFRDVTGEAGLSNPLWASSAGWGDLDGDGDLDLYVCNYVDYDPYDPIACLDENGNPGTCHPHNVDPVPNVCYINRGDGRFVEQADARGLNGPGSKSLGVVIADLTGDGLMDVYVANDTTANHLFVNQGEGTFTEQALTLGCSTNGLGQFQASMGVAFGDYDRNGWPDLYVTHFTEDSNTLYQHLGPPGFTDTTQTTGLHQPTLSLLGFGTVMADFNADGWQDLFVANGHIDDWRDVNGDDWYMRPQLFRYDGRLWQECGAEAGSYFEQVFLGRAVASADYDHDGDLDLMVVNQNDPAALLENRSELGHWLQIRLVGTTSNRRGIGARVTVEQGDLRLVSHLAGGTSYCTSHQPIIPIGLGESDQPCRIVVDWPGAGRQTWEGVAVDSFVTLIENEADAR